jgi:hypothetical protein
MDYTDFTIGGHRWLSLVVQVLTANGVGGSGCGEEESQAMGSECRGKHLNFLARLVSCDCQDPGNLKGG